MDELRQDTLGDIAWMSIGLGLLVGMRMMFLTGEQVINSLAVFVLLIVGGLSIISLNRQNFKLARVAIMLVFILALVAQILVSPSGAMRYFFALIVLVAGLVFDWDGILTITALTSVIHIGLARFQGVAWLDSTQMISVCRSSWSI